MNQDNKKSGTCKCEYCHCDVPVSSALSAESAQYLYYFCGEACLKKWEEERKHSNDTHDKSSGGT